VGLGLITIALGVEQALSDLGLILNINLLA